MLHNDYSERAFQLERGGQWVKGKSADTFAPLGPWLVTADEIPNPQQLADVADRQRRDQQKSTTANMIFDVFTLVSYVSQFMTLLPGDVITTGTPAGVGLGMKPEPRYLRPAMWSNSASMVSAPRDNRWWRTHESQGAYSA